MEFSAAVSAFRRASTQLFSRAIRVCAVAVCPVGRVFIDVCDRAGVAAKGNSSRRVIRRISSAPPDGSRDEIKREFSANATRDGKSVQDEVQIWVDYRKAGCRRANCKGDPGPVLSRIMR